MPRRGEPVIPPTDEQLTIVLLRKLRHRGAFKVGWIFRFAASAYNLVRMRNLLPTPVQAA